MRAYAVVQALAGETKKDGGIMRLAIWTAFARHLQTDVKKQGIPVRDFWNDWKKRATQKEFQEHLEALGFVDDLWSKHPQSLPESTYIHMGCLAALNKRGVSLRCEW